MLNNILQKTFRGLIMKKIIVIRSNNLFNLKFQSSNASFGVKLNFVRESFLFVVVLLNSRD